MDAPAEIDVLAERLHRHVLKLAERSLAVGGAGHRRAAEYIRAQLGEFGFPAHDVPFHEAGIAGVNLLSRPQPDRMELPLLIVGAHYDSIPGSPGADDNASAVAALLELAKWIGPRLRTHETMSARLQLAAYDLEECGMIGSFVHCREVRNAGSAVLGMLSLEMLAYTSPHSGSQQLPPHLAKMYPRIGNFIGICGNEASQSLLRTVTDAMRTIEELPVESLAVPGNGESFPEVRLSDHSSFWDHGYHALMITDTSFFRNPHYHQVSDKPDTLDYQFLAKVTQGVCKAVHSLLT